MSLELDTGKPDAPKKGRPSKAEQERWTVYAAAALSALIRTDTSPTHAAERAARHAEAMLAQHKKRWTDAPSP
jgi:hypothetical protein